MQQLAGYRLVALLGEGGMGQVHLARSPSGRLVAVKAVHEHLAAEPEFRERFRREVLAARSVGGPFTAAVLDADPDAARPWLATAFCSGLTLTEAVAAHGPLGPGELATLGAALAEALAAIHAAGLVHRDLKPSNVVVTRDGPMVLDFGIAKATAEESLTGTGQLVGSPGFVAPELIRGAAEPGPAADVFALGALLAYAGSGRPPFGTGPAHQVLYRTLHDLPDLDGVPDEQWRDFLGSALAAGPDGRPGVGDVLGWCVRRAADEPWWEGGRIAALIGRREEDVAALVARAETEETPSAAGEQERTERSASAPSRRRLLRWSGTLLLGGSAAAAVVALSPYGKDDQSPKTSPPPVSYQHGRALWSRPVGPAALLRGGDALYVRATSALTRLDARTGAVRWTYTADDIADALIADGLVHVLRSGDLLDQEIVALDPGTGREKWVTPDLWLNPRRPPGAPTLDNLRRADGSEAALTVSDGIACLITYASYSTLWEQRTARGQRWRAYGFDSRTGKDLWFYEGSAAGVVGVDQAGGRIAVAASATSQNDSDRGLELRKADPLFVLRAADGTLESRIPGGALRPQAHRGSTGTRYYAVGKDISGVDLNSGRTLWRRALGERAGVTPLATRGVVHTATRTEFGALDARTGKTRWSRIDVEGLSDGNRTPLVAGSLVYVRGPEPGSQETASSANAWGVHALDSLTGRLVWAAGLDSTDDITAVAGPGLIHLSAGGTLYAFALPEAS
ncbi:PQQ-binding-like beta-propeller repeat protein [Streptomyces sp. NBC_01410]|uniref:protein kinase domain-containing protein n=1 Tax=Streptomyces sp. NBC_01410 TaxID=2903856 RepID=UPI00324468DF